MGVLRCVGRLNELERETKVAGRISTLLGNFSYATRGWHKGLKSMGWQRDYMVVEGHIK